MADPYFKLRQEVHVVRNHCESCRALESQMRHPIKVNEDTKFDKTDFRNIVPRFTPENRKANQAVVDLVRQIAERKKAAPAQIALAWLLAQKPWIVPIPGTTKLERLEENVGAVGVELTSHDLREIDSAASKITVQGARYPEELQKLVGR